ncbi:thioredoxin-related transmembrane protein 1-like [Tubulanus polymorphus]|uniref:thioredoxin-related transmembrane protein 1-like n=1 Tax=Tubulanus polymorphus TaxID=672921 RepID=UPI003DA572EF
MSSSSSLFILFKCAIIASVVADSVVNLNENTWDEMLTGEWMVEFFAPWCPACRSLAPHWQQFAKNAKTLNIKIAHVDITENPALSGRFFVTALPTIYHVKDGIFRVYRGDRSEMAFVDYVKQQKWKDVEAIPWYQSPDAYHMSLVSSFFKASVFIRNMHNYITEDFGIPVWGSYLFFAVLTIIAGLLLALLLVCLCDCIFPVIDVKPAAAASAVINSADDKDEDVVDDDSDDKQTEPVSLRKRKIKATID